LKSWNRKGDDFYKLGQHKQAVECYDKFIELSEP
jgi:hypothetical protein